MTVVCATDDNFVQHCCVMLVSLLSNNSDVTVYVLTEGLRPDNEQAIKDEVAAKAGAVHFCKVDPAVIRRFPMPAGAELAHISRATYYRLLIADLLPPEVEKVLYLDCDIIVNGPVEELWQTPLDSYALAAVLQIGYGSEALRLRYPIEFGYFNAGVTLMNLRYFREHDVTRRLMDYIASHYHDIKYHDQDTLNAVLYKETLHLMPQWNMTPGIYAPGFRGRADRQGDHVVNDYGAEKDNALRHKRHPLVLHFVSKPKPWSHGCTHPLAMLYYRYARQTLHFSHIKPQNTLARWWAILRYSTTMRLSLLLNRTLFAE
jgi:lipopolysaccharide biosynthesis glycosyltransferase